jgi:hypothetical protein
MIFKPELRTMNQMESKNFKISQFKRKKTRLANLINSIQKEAFFNNVIKDSTYLQRFWRTQKIFQNIYNNKDEWIPSPLMIQFSENEENFKSFWYFIGNINIIKDTFQRDGKIVNHRIFSKIRKNLKSDTKILISYGPEFIT